MLGKQPSWRVTGKLWLWTGNVHFETLSASQLTTNDRNNKNVFPLLVSNTSDPPLKTRSLLENHEQPRECFTPETSEKKNKQEMKSHNQSSCGLQLSPRGTALLPPLRLRVHKQSLKRNLFSFHFKNTYGTSFLV